MMTDDGRSGAVAPSGHSPSGLSQSSLSQAQPSVPNADDRPRPGKSPCGSCPYRRDVPAGIWHPSEYAKLPAYDRETFEQPLALFFCHQQDGRLCAGWVGCHDTDELLALRFHRVDPDTFSYKSPIALFSSGEEAAAHGLAGVLAPDENARRTISKLSRRQAIATEAGTAETVKHGSVHEGAGRQASPEPTPPTQEGPR